MGAWCDNIWGTSDSASREERSKVEGALEICAREFLAGTGDESKVAAEAVVWIKDRFRPTFFRQMRDVDSAWEQDSSWLVRKFHKIGRHARQHAGSGVVDAECAQWAAEEVIRLAHLEAA